MSSSNMHTSLSPQDSAMRLEQLRHTTPLIHNITNYVAMNSMANILLALGASPAMVHAREEVAEFASIAHALTINIGTLSADWLEAMQQAARSATQHGKPWVFDPVAVGATQYRQQAGRLLIAERPSVIRGNASEILALAQQASTGRGVDSTAASDAARDAASELARATGAVVAVTGEIDLVTDGKRLARIHGGHPMMPRVTTLGCSLTGVVAAFIATSEDTFLATCAALACYAEAGRIAGAASSGPGSFSSAFLDALYQLDAGSLPPVEITHVE
ncbi:hydroxyethylthiazole kinase [Halomonas huangheensis]|nr:hydroxyethylthiazole kinase [Halomonas huangheensis]